MTTGNHRRLIRAATAIALASLLAGQASAYLYWIRPDFSGPPVRGDEPGIALPVPAAKPEELRANLVWTLRAALNVAALQCQFSSPLMTVKTYNTILSQHGEELSDAYKTLGGYFKRTRGKTWQREFDAHTTQSYNGLSTFHAQLGFCETAAKVGKAALAARRGQLFTVAEQHMREVRNSLVPKGDMMFASRTVQTETLPPLDDRCWKKGKLKKKCMTEV